MAHLVGKRMLRIHRRPRVLKLVGLSDTTLWRRVRAGDFPAPFRLSPRAVGWLASDIEDWIQSRASRRIQHKRAAQHAGAACQSEAT